MKEQLIAKIKEICSDEKFRLDAYFFCGFPSGTPNEKLLRACEAYLKTVEEARPDRAVTEQMLAQMEAAVEARSGSKAVANLVDNAADIRVVLAHREVLLAE